MGFLDRAYVREVLDPRLLVQEENLDVVLEVHGVHFPFAAAADSPDGSARNRLVVNQALAHLPGKSNILTNRHVFHKPAHLHEN